MSTAAATPRPRRHLHLAATPSRSASDTGSATAGDTWSAQRPPLLRVCAGEPLLLSDSDVDLVALVNRSDEIEPWLLDDQLDPDEYRLAEVLMEYLCDRYGTQRRGKGDRIISLESIYRRHLLPFLIELDASLPVHDRGVAAKRLRHLKKLPKILAGDAPLPAATVAGDQLGRRGIACVFLDPADAARVVAGGVHALEVALREGNVALHTDVRTGQEIIRTAELRAAGLLIERAAPHGFPTSTAGNVLRDLRNAIEQARAHGAAIRGTFNLIATEPLAGNRMRAPRVPARYVALRDIAVTSPHLPPIGQVVLWLERLTGDRISESYGPQVSDYWRDPTGQGWLRIDKQGGVSSLGRDPETGQYVQQDRKDHTKTPAGVRTIPLAAPLAALLDLLITVFHTDAEAGEIDGEARLIPGIQSENTSGQPSFRTWLGTAQERSGTSFLPHDLRAALITDLKDAGVEERLAHYYAGHEHPDPTIQDEYYDHGPQLQLLLPIVQLLEQQLDDELGTDKLHAPTALRHQWGRDTRRHRQQHWIEQQLLATGWRQSVSDPTGGSLLRAPEVAVRIDQHPSRARELMRTGVITAHTTLWGTRPAWVAHEADVQRYLERTAGRTLTDLAADWGSAYHHLWQLARDLGVVDDDRRPGTALYLSPDQAARLRAELDRRAAVAADALTVYEAAETLGMGVTPVETLIRQGALELTAGPTGARRRYVTRASVSAFASEHPPQSPDGDVADDLLLTCRQAAKLMGLTRPQLTSLITTRQVQDAKKPGSRHVYVTARAGAGNPPLASRARRANSSATCSGDNAWPTSR